MMVGDETEYLHRIIETVSADYLEVRLQKSSGERIRYTNGRVEGIHNFQVRDIAVRALKNGSWMILHRSDLREGVLRDLPSIILRSMEGLPEGDARVAGSEPCMMKKEIKGRDVSLEEKIEFLEDLQSSIMEDFLIWSSTILYSEVTVFRRIITSEGGDLSEKIPFSLFRSTISTKRSSYSGSFGFSGEVNGAVLKEGIEKMHTATISQLRGRMVKPGRYDVILAPSLTGLFIEEVVGHPAEGDFIAEGKSHLKGVIGEQIAPDSVTVLDAPVEGSFGLMFFDDEGVPARRKEIVKEGVLTGYIHSRESAALLGDEPNGGGRGEMGKLQAPRLSTIYMERGDFEMDELLEVPYGIYADGAAGGYLSMLDQRFEINAQEAYIIENGEFKQPLMGISIRGRVDEALMKIDAVGKDFSIVNAGFDDKRGQVVPVSRGGPSIRILDVWVE